MKRQPFLFLLCIVFLYSCTLSKQIERSARKTVLENADLKAAHIGISIYEPATGKYLYNYQGDKYFVPASNTKIPTCYAAMKYLGDSLVGLRYGFALSEHTLEPLSLLVIQPTADPTFLHEDYGGQKVFTFLKEKYKIEKYTAAIMDTAWQGQNEQWGSGWSWNDYAEPYMAERNSLPVFGNVLQIKLNETEKRPGKEVWPDLYEQNLFKTQSRYFDSIINKSLGRTSKRKMSSSRRTGFEIRRDIASNNFYPTNKETYITQKIPFITNRASTAIHILEDTLKTEFGLVFPVNERNKYQYDCPNCDIPFIYINKWNIIYSQPTDSLLKPMMHRSDNFFAEQSLLMVSNEMLGIMNDERIIDTLVKTDFKDLPQKPRWVDGSGLSRYNLFSPQDFVTILNKMRTEFGMERIKEILPTGNEGTLSNYYKAESGHIFAKTGTLSGVVALSGFLYTKKNKLLIFSVLVNNHQASSTAVRRAVEKFIEGIRKNKRPG